MSINNFSRPYNRATVTVPGTGILCVCRARAGYRLQSGSTVLYRCPLCARNYAAPNWQAEPLPHVRDNFEQLIYSSYREQRTRSPHIEPHRWESVSTLFKGRIEEFEARYQRELDEARRAS